MLNENDEKCEVDFIIGGAKIAESACSEFRETFNTQACNCGMFEPSISKCSLNICDNCLFARALKENSTTTYCIKQKNHN